MIYDGRLSAIQRVCIVWRSAGVCSRPSALHHLHAWTTTTHYCTGSASDNLYRRLQAVQNAKCRSTPHHQHEKVRAHHARPASATLASSPPTCVQFKIAVLVYKVLHDLLPAYLAEDCQLVSVTGRQQLRSSDIDTCLPQWTTQVMAIAYSLLLDLANGTVCQPNCESLALLHSDNFDEHSKRIHFVSGSCSADWLFFVHRVQIRLLTYLWTEGMLRNTRVPDLKVEHVTILYSLAKSFWEFTVCRSTGKKVKWIACTSTKFLSFRRVSVVVHLELMDWSNQLDVVLGQASVLEFLKSWTDSYTQSEQPRLINLVFGDDFDKVPRHWLLDKIDHEDCWKFLA